MEFTIYERRALSRVRQQVNKRAKRKVIFWSILITLFVVAFVADNVLHLTEVTPVANAKQVPDTAVFAPQIIDPAGAVIAMADFCQGYRADMKDLHEKPPQEVVKVCKKYKLWNVTN